MIKKLIQKLKTKKLITVESHSVILTDDLLINKHQKGKKINIKVRPI